MRLFNIIASVIGLLVCGLAFPLIALAVRLDSEGPIIYNQYRVGKKRKLYPTGKPFKMYKVRTMKVDSEPNGEQWATDNDDRITKVGGFLRKTHIDELPQLWNVLLGEMSLVGPRPERPGITSELRKQVKDYDDRLDVLPGITGLAQIINGYDGSIDSVKRKVDYDKEYIEKQSLAEDLRILLMTFTKVTKG